MLQDRAIYHYLKDRGTYMYVADQGDQGSEPPKPNQGDLWDSHKSSEKLLK